MRYASIRKMDVSNGPGFGISLFTQGCNIRCKGCFNPETWDYNAGKDFTDESISTIINLMDNEHISRLSILGGEPLSNCNLFMLSKLIQRAKTAYPNKTIWLWSGYTWEVLQEKRKTNNYLNFILNNLDYIIVGPFIEEQKDLTLKWRGSSNQRIIKLQNDNIIDITEL